MPEHFYRRECEFLIVEANVRQDGVTLELRDSRAGDSKSLYLTTAQAQVIIDGLRLAIEKAERWSPGFYRES